MKYYILIALLLATNSSFGCICWNDSFPSTYLNQNDTLPANQMRFIIKGIVIDKEVGEKVYHRWGHGNLVNIKVLEYWPSTSNMNDTITIINDEMTCAAGFKIDSTYLIGAYNVHRYLSTSSCEGTGLLSKFSKQEISKLGRSGIPSTSSSNRQVRIEEPNKTSYSKNVTIVFLLLSVLLNIILIARRKDVHNKR